MARIERFEDLDAWQKSRNLTREIYQITSEGEFSRDFGLKDQIRRASVSIMSNIAEGFERKSDKEFNRFLTIAKGSAGEVQSQLYVALDCGFLTQQTFDQLYSAISEISRLIGGLMRYLSKSST